MPILCEKITGRKIYVRVWRAAEGTWSYATRAVAADRPGPVIETGDGYRTKSDALADATLLIGEW